MAETEKSCKKCLKSAVSHAKIYEIITGGPLGAVCVVSLNHERLCKRGGNRMNILDAITEEYKKSDVPAFSVGDTVKVSIKIKEGQRERVQIFVGFVLKKQNGGIAETFTVRRIASGVGVEKTFPVHSPLVEKIEVVRRGDVRRAKLNYMRERTGKAAKIKSKEL